MPALRIAVTTCMKILCAKRYSLCEDYDSMKDRSISLGAWYTRFFPATDRIRDLGQDGVGITWRSSPCRHVPRVPARGSCSSPPAARWNCSRRIPPKTSGRGMDRGETDRQSNQSTRCSRCLCVQGFCRWCGCHRIVSAAVLSVLSALLRLLMSSAVSWKHRLQNQHHNRGHVNFRPCQSVTAEVVTQANNTSILLNPRLCKAILQKIFVEAIHV